MTQDKILVADIGGSHMTVGDFQVSTHGFGFQSLIRKDVDSKGSSQQIIKEWADCIGSLFSPSDNVKLGIAFPAPFDYENGICLIEEQGKFEKLYKQNIRESLALKLKIDNSQIRFINDAKAFLVGESYFGFGRGYENILGLTLGSGLGSSLKLKTGISDAALWSSPFKTGIAEDYLGSGWFINWIKKELGLVIKGVKELIEDPKFDNKRELIFDIYSRNLADFIEIQMLRNPLHLVIFGGNISRAHNHFLPQTVELLKNKDLNIELKISDLGEKSALMGAAAIFLDKEQLVSQGAVVR